MGDSALNYNRFVAGIVHLYTTYTGELLNLQKNIYNIECMYLNYKMIKNNILGFNNIH